jgi:zinc protease
VFFMNRSRHLRRAAWAVALLGALVLPPALRAAEPRKIATIEGITEYELDNGLRVLLFPDASAPRVTVNLTVLVGSRHEGYGETGMAHLLEHMLFKGTPQHPDVPKALRDHGANFNGTTWVDRTNYFETLPAGDENLEFAIRLEADRMVNSYVKREDLASEMTVVRNEFEAGENSPQGILMQRMMGAAYEWHNYGKSTIGNRSDIERVPIDKLQGFYRKYYQPDNAVLIVAGNFDSDKALGLVGKYFGPLKKPARRLDTTYTEEPAQDGERSVTLRRVGKSGVVGAVYHIPAGSHEDFAAVEVLEDVLTSEPSGRLYKALVPTKKASGVQGIAFGYHDPGTLLIMAETGSEDEKALLEVRDVMTEELEKLGTQKVTTEEVGRAKAKLLAQREQLMKDANRIGTTLSDWVAKGDWRLFFLHRDRLAKVTADDVTRVAGKYLQRSNRTVGLYVPTAQVTRTPIPETPDVAALVKDYKGGTAVAAGEAFDPTPENIEKRVQRSELGGIKVALLPKKSRGEAVVLRLTLRFGNADSLKGQVTAADFLGSVLERGTAKHNYQQLQDELNQNKISLSVSSDTGELSVTIQCKRSTLPRAMELLREVLREPTFPKDEFDILKREQLTQLRQGSTEPQVLAQTALRRKISPYPSDDVRYTPTIEEAIAQVEKVTVEDVRKLYEQQVGAVAGEVAVVGDFDAEPTAKALGGVLKDWKSGTQYKRIERTAHTDVKGEKVVIETPDKANSVYVAAQSLAMNDEHADYPALTVANYIFGGGPLASRLADRVRRKDGLSYGVGSVVQASSLDKVGALIMFAIANPKNTEKVDKAIAEEMERFLKEGATAKEVEEARKAYLAAAKNQRSSDGALAGLLVGWLHAGRTSAYMADFEKKVGEATAEQVNEAFRRNIDPKRLVIVEAGDFSKK